MTPTERDRFWARVDIGDPAACWPWTRGTFGGGRGEIRLVGQYYLAYRVAYRDATGVDPGPLLVCHQCDNPACCNPAHLFLGTDLDNNRDMHLKGRAAVGSRMRAARLIESDIPVIRHLLNAGQTQKEVADRYGVHIMTISDIARGKTWRHVPEDAPTRHRVPRIPVSEAEEILARNAQGESYRHIAVSYGTNRGYIRSVVRAYRQRTRH